MPRRAPAPKSLTEFHGMLPKSDGLRVLLAGATAAAAFAPVGYFLLAPLAVAVLLDCWQAVTPGRAFRLGGFFGLGMFGAGVSWVYVSCHDYGGLSVPVSALLALLLVVYLALYPALVGYCYRRFWSADPAPIRLLVVVPALWVLLEAMRERLFTGFGWLAMGYSQIDGPLSGFAPLAGQPLVSWAVVTTAAATVLWVRSPRRLRLLAIGVLVTLWVGGWALGRVVWSQPVGEVLEVALVQGNITQQLKWNPQMRRDAMLRYLTLSEPHHEVDLLLWPETAVPEFADQLDSALLQPYAQALAAGSGPLLISGLLWRDLASGQYYNGVVAATEGLPRFLKHHLVPFGEYVPLAGLLGQLLSLFEVPYSAFSAGPVKQPFFEINGQQIGVSICYEDVFGEELRQRLPASGFLLNVSNDGWFGRSAAPYQHLEIARMRALESGRYLLRATNTGVSAIIDGSGGVVASAPLDVTDVVRGQVVSLTGDTPYARWGVMPLYILALLLLALARLRWRSTVS
ncbi:MAG: apolipoprotein N-acyltransferase [Gammaproteobacteria bacterium]|nr:apolipoprotein N-acyltransferase [Gammaproteobacteria bacterium]